MDANWFKQQQKRAGVTAEDIARRAGKARSNISHIYSGNQKMSLEWAQAFADVLGVPLADVLEHAGVTDQRTARTIAPGFSEGDATAWIPKDVDRRITPTIADALGARAGVDIWCVSSPAMALQGLLPGDYMLVDTHAAERAKAGDTVIAQIYDNLKGRATTVLRRLEPPVLVAASTDPADNRVHVVDGVNVVIRGTVIASWRV